jgi:hypothetical protein
MHVLFPRFINQAIQQQAIGVCTSIADRITDRKCMADNQQAIGPPDQLDLLLDQSFLQCVNGLY